MQPTMPGLTDSEKGYLKAIDQADEGQPTTDQLEVYGVAKSYRERPDKLEGKIRDRVETLPRRVEGLLDEIAVLRATGFLKDDHPDVLAYQTLFQGGRGSASGPPTERPLQHFGERLATAMVDLFGPLQNPHASIERQLVVGFVEGLCRHADDRDALLDTLAETVSEQRNPPDVTVKAEGIELPEHIRTVIDQADVIPRGGWVSTTAFVHDIQNRLAPAPSEDRLPGEAEILQVIRDHNLVARAELRGELRDDLAALERLAWNGVTGSHVLEAIPPEGGETGHLAERVAADADRSRKTALPAVGRFGRYLAGEPFDEWGQVESPLVELDKSGKLLTWQIDLTAYGTVAAVATHLSVGFPWRLADPLAGVPDELIDHALEVGTYTNS